MDSRHLYGCAAVLLAGSIAAGAMLRRSVTAGLRTEGASHFVVHAVLFACLTGLLVQSTRSLGMRWALCVVAVLLGFGTEWYEHLKDGYPIESMDVLADALGVALAMLVTLPRWGAPVWRGREGSHRSSPR